MPLPWAGRHQLLFESFSLRRIRWTSCSHYVNAPGWEHVSTSKEYRAWPCPRSERVRAAQVYRFRLSLLLAILVIMAKHSFCPSQVLYSTCWMSQNLIITKQRPVCLLIAAVLIPLCLPCVSTLRLSGTKPTIGNAYAVSQNVNPRSLGVPLMWWSRQWTDLAREAAIGVCLKC